MANMELPLWCGMADLSVLFQRNGRFSQCTCHTGYYSCNQRINKFGQSTVCFLRGLFVVWLTWFDKFIRECSSNYVFIVPKCNSIRGLVGRSVRGPVRPSVGKSIVSQKMRNQRNSTKFNKLRDFSQLLASLVNSSGTWFSIICWKGEIFFFVETNIIHHSLITQFVITNNNHHLSFVTSQGRG